MDQTLTLMTAVHILYISSVKARHFISLMPKLADIAHQEICLRGVRAGVTLFLYQRSTDKLK